MTEEEQDRSGEPADAAAMAGLIQSSEIPKDDLETPPTPGQTPAPKEEPPKETPPPEPPKEQTPPAPKEGEPPKEPSKEEPTPKEPPKDEPDEDKLFKKIDGIRLRKDASPRTHEAFEELKTISKSEHAARVEAEKKLKEATAQEALTPELKQKLQDLEHFKATFDIENDPQFVAQYDTALKNANTEGMRLLKSWNLHESAFNYIENNGGILKFRYSTNFMPEKFKNEDGTRMTQSQWWDKTILARLSPSQRDDINDVLGYMRNTQRQKDLVLADVRANKDTYIKKNQEATEKSTKEWVQRVQEHSKKVLETYGDIAKLRDLPKNATPELKKEIEAHNARYKKAEAIATGYITKVTPESLTESAIAAAYAQVAKDEIKEVREKLAAETARADAAEKQIQKIKDSGSTGRRMTITETAPKKAAVVPPHGTSDEQAMKDLIQQMERNQE